MTITYPTGVEYREALYNTKVCFKDPALVGGKVAMDQLGMPKPISGASASVFTIEEANGRRWAVKCFTRSVDQQATRYQHISDALRAINKPWRVHFEYLPQGVLSYGTWFPVLKMEWVDAIGLLSYIEKNLWESAKLADLAFKFAQMIEDLSVLGIAHGDLQHGNLLVTPSGELKLIDYDGMYVPGLAQIGACEKGLANYQSPARTMSTWGPYLDNFSAWIIYSSLVALAIDPTLWTLLHDQGDEALLFNHLDFEDQHNSRALQAFARSPSSDLQALGNAMSQMWAHDIRTIPALDPAALPDLTKQFGGGGTVLSAGSAASAATSSGTIPVWVIQAQMADQTAVPQANVGSSHGDASWISGHLAPLPPVAFHPSKTPIRLLVGLWLVLFLATGGSIIAGVLLTKIAGSIAFVVVLAFLVTSTFLFRKTPEWKDRHEKRSVFKARKIESSKAVQVVSALERARREIDTKEQKEIGQLNKEAERAKASEEKELAYIDKRLASLLGSLEKQKQRSASAESGEMGSELRALQRRHVADRLSRTRISSAGIPGIGPAVVRSLAASGIQSAADFNGICYIQGPRGGRQTCLRRSDGAAVRPTGVGEKKAGDLAAWRAHVERAALATQPSSLPSPQAQAIRSKYLQQRQALADQERESRTKAGSDRTQVIQKWMPIRSAVTGKLLPARQAFAQERAQADLRLAAAKKQAGANAWQSELAHRELAAYRNVNYFRYLTRAIRR